MGLKTSEKETLLRIARSTIEHRLKGRPLPPLEDTSSVLRGKRGAFVTLHKRGELRGCIGYIVARKPLRETVREMAEAAAFQDARFPPVTADELEELDVEISVLSPLRKVADAEEIEVGKHGILIKKGYYQGLLLPQVAVEYGWDRTTFLRQTCRKAGLPPDAWKDPDAEIRIFSAEVFGEK